MRRFWMAGAGLLLLLAGCSSATMTETQTTETQTTETQTTETRTTEQDLLARHGLSGLDAVEIVDQLDRLSRSDRPDDLMASVRPDELLLADAEGELALPIPDDRFYLSVAPYLDRTHDCFHHSLTTCQGELAGEDVGVTVVDGDSGEVLVDEETTTFENGFVGLWLPRDVAGTIRVSHDGHTAELPFATGDDDPTCLTTLQLR